MIVSVPRTFANDIEMTEVQVLEFALLRAAGCHDRLPLVGHHENTVRCRLCSIEVLIDRSSDAR